MAGENEVKILLDLIVGGNLKDANRELDTLLNKYERIAQIENSSIARAQQSITNSIKQTQQAQKELENSTKSLGDEQKKQVNGYKKEVETLNGEIKKLETAQNGFAKAQEQSTQRQIQNTRKLQQELKGIREELDKGGDPGKIRQLEVEYQRVSQQIRDSRNEAKLLAQQNQVLENSYSGIVLRNKQLRESLNRIPWNDTTGDLDRLKREFRANTEALKRFDNELGQSFRNVGNYEESIKNAVHSLSGLGGALSGITGGGTSGLGLISGGLGAIGGLGIAGGPAIAAIGGIVAGFDALLDSSKQVNAELTKTSAITKLQGQELRTVTAELRAQANIFKQDYNEGLRAANSAVQSFGGNFSDAIDEINRGLLQGADINGDFLDQIREYSPQFEAAGLSLKTLVDTAILGAQEGIFSDKAADAVKEATIRLRELTPATRSALKGIGLVVDDIEKGLRAGTLSIADVIAQVSDRLNVLPGQSAEVGAAIADIFGGPGEDAGLRFLRSLTDINKELGVSTENLSIFQQQQQKQLDAQEKLNKAQVEFSSLLTGVGNAIGIFSDTVLADLINGLSKVLSLFVSNTEQARRFGETIGTLNRQEVDKATEETTKRIERLGKELEVLNLRLEAAKEGQLSALGGGTTVTIQQEINRVSQEIVALSDNLGKLKDRTEELDNPIKDLTATQKEQIRQYRNLVDATRDYKTELTTEEVEELTKAVEKQKDAADAAQKAFEKYKEELKKLKVTTNEVLRGPLATVSEGDRISFEALFGVSVEKAVQEFQEDIKKFQQLINEGEALPLTGSLKKIEAGLIKRGELFEEQLKREDELRKEEKKKIEEHEEEIRQIRQASFDLASELVFTFYSLRINNLQRELEAVDDAERRKLEAVAGNEQAQASIQEEYDRRRRQIRQQEARAERSAAIFSIILNTASAVVEALPNYVLAALVGLTGAAQLAVASSAPIPQFFKGTQSSPEGPALVGEKGWELLERAGRFMMTNDGPQLMHLRAGTRVYTHEQSQRMIQERPEILRQALQVRNDSVSSYDRQQQAELQRLVNIQNKRDNQELIDGFRKAVQDIPVSQTYIDEQGLHRLIKRRSGSVEILNKLRKW